MPLDTEQDWDEFQRGVEDMASKWEREHGGIGEPDADEAGGAPDGDADDHAMVLPEMDFSGQQAPMAAPEPPAAPTRMPPAHMATPATTGAGKKALPQLSPREPVESLDWKGLAQRMSLGRANDDLTNTFNNSIAGVVNQHLTAPPKTSAGEDAAKLPLELLRAKQGVESRGLAMQGQKAALGVKAADNDPNSLQSQKARNAIKSFFPGMQMPAGFDEWSAADVKRFADTGQLSRMQATKAAADERVRKAQADEAERQRKIATATEKAQAEQQALENSRQAFAPELKKLGVDPTKASKWDIEKAIALGHNKATEAVAASNNALARAAEERRKGEHEALTEPVPFAGTKLHYRGVGTPREDDRREVQKVSSLYGSAIAGMDDLASALDAFARHPSQETKDNVAAKAHVVGGHLNTAAGQGAMSQDEAKAMSAALGTDILSPTGLQAFVEKFIGNDAKAAATLTRKLRSVRETARTSALGKIKAYNYEPEAAAVGGSGKIRVRNKKTGQTGSVSPQFFDESKYERIDG